MNLGWGVTSTLNLQGKKVRVEIAAVAPGLGGHRPSLVDVWGPGTLRGSSTDGRF